MDIPVPLARLALFFDIDGTLIDIAERPQDVVVPHSLRDALARLQVALGGAVALVSGRSLAEIDRLFAPLKLSASGVHGAELRLEADGDVLTDDQFRVPPEVRADVATLAQAFDRTIVEDKAFSIAVHYRQNPAAGPAILQALEKLVGSQSCPDLRILPGHMVFEIKRATFDKGKAIQSFLGHAPFSDRTPVFLGDDVTDKPGFDAVLNQGGYAYSVGQDLPGLSGTFADAAAVRGWLVGLVAAETAQV